MAKKSRRKENVGRARIIEARRARERKRQQRYWTAAGIVGLVLLLIFGVGLYDTWVRQPSEPIAVVDGQSIRTDTYQKYVRFIRGQARSRLQQLLAQQQQFGDDPSFAQFKQLIEQNIRQAQAQEQGAPQQAFDTLIDTELIKAEAKQRGINVTDQELDAEVQRQVAASKGYVTEAQATATSSAAITATATAQAQPSPTPTATPQSTLTPAPGVTETQPIAPEPSPTPPHIITADEFKLEYTNLLTNLGRGVGWSEAEYREVVRNDLLHRKLNEQFAVTVPTTTEQIHARHILVDTQEQADGVLQRLKNGESFEALAKELSKDTSNKDQAGDLGWFPRGQMVKPFEDAAFALKPNEFSAPVQTNFGYHIIQLLEGPGLRPLDASALRQKQSAALSNWLSERKEQLRKEGKLISYYSPSKDPR